MNIFLALPRLNPSEDRATWLEILKLFLENMLKLAKIWEPQRDEESLGKKGEEVSAANCYKCNTCSIWISRLFVSCLCFLLHTKSAIEISWNFFPRKELKSSHSCSVSFLFILPLICHRSVTAITVTDNWHERGDSGDFCHSCLLTENLESQGHVYPYLRGSCVREGEDNRTEAVTNPSLMKGRWICTGWEGGEGSCGSGGRERIE